jgi:hypothetical protein
MADEMRRQLAEAVKNNPEFGALAELTTEELVALTRAGSAVEGYAAEIARRQVEATAKLQKALGDTSSKLYWLTVVLTLYTIILVIFAAAVYLKG